MGLPTDSVVKVNVPPPSSFDQASIGLGFCDSMRCPLSESGRLVALSRTSDPVVLHPSTRISWRLRTGKGACATDAGLKLLRRAQDKPALRERRKQGIGPTLRTEGEGWGARKSLRSPAGKGTAGHLSYKERREDAGLIPRSSRSGQAGGATKAPGPRDFFTMALSLRAAGEPAPS